MENRLQKIQENRFVLASKSPRRQDIFKGLGLSYRIETKDVDESFSETLQAGEIPLFLSQVKASAFDGSLAENEILVTADTVVWINGHALNKPENLAEAKQMLQEISGATHEVFTAVSLTTATKQHSFVEGTKVQFHELTEAEIDFYLSQYQPLDKAGAYGIQEFIGYIGIQKIEGDFYNVVGFPVQRFWRELSEVIEG
jgi:septum formation protein